MARGLTDNARANATRCFSPRVQLTKVRGVLFHALRVPLELRDEPRELMGISRQGSDCRQVDEDLATCCRATVMMTTERTITIPAAAMRQPNGSLKTNHPRNTATIGLT